MSELEKESRRRLAEAEQDAKRIDAGSRLSEKSRLTGMGGADMKSLQSTKSSFKTPNIVL